MQLENGSWLTITQIAILLEDLNALAARQRVSAALIELSLDHNCGEV